LDWERAESAPVEATWQMPACLWDQVASGSTQLKWVNPDDIPLDSELIFELLTFARLGLDEGIIP